MNFLDVMFPMASAQVSAGQFLGGKRKNFGISSGLNDAGDAIFGGYGYQDMSGMDRLINDYSNTWEQMYSQSNPKKFVGDYYSKLGDEARQMSESAGQNAVDKELMYGATGGSLERAKRQAALGGLDTWAGVEKDKAQAMMLAEQQDRQMRMNQADRLAEMNLAKESARLGSYGRRGGLFG
jgi:hypothetical protein